MSSGSLAAIVSSVASHTFMRGDSDADGDDVLLQHVIEIRRQVSTQISPPVAAAIQLGAHLHLNYIISHSTHEELIYEATWALTNLASGDAAACAALMASQSHTHLISLLTHKSLRIAEQAAWAIGNLAGEGAAVRDVLLTCQCSSGATLVEQMESLYDTAVERSKEASHEGEAALWPSIRNNVVWVLSNLCRGKPQPSLAIMRPSFPFLRRVLQEAPVDSEALIDALWAISYLTDGPNERIDEAIKAGLLGECCERLMPPAAILRPLEISGADPASVFRRPHDYVQASLVPVDSLSLAFHYLPTSHLRSMALGCKDWFYDVVFQDVPLYCRMRRTWSTDPKIKAVVLRILGNIVTGDDLQTEAALQMGFLDIVEQLASQGEQQSLRRELCWSLSNITAGTSAQVLQVLNRPSIVKFVLQEALGSDEQGVREAVYVISNATSEISPSDAHRIAENGWLLALVLAAEQFHMSPKIVSVASEGLIKCAVLVTAAAGNGSSDNLDSNRIDRVKALLSHTTSPTERAVYLQRDMETLRSRFPFDATIFLELIIPRIAFLSSSGFLHPLCQALFRGLAAHAPESGLADCVREAVATNKRIRSFFSKRKDGQKADVARCGESLEEEEEAEEEEDGEEEEEAEEEEETEENVAN